MKLFNLQHVQYEMEKMVLYNGDKAFVGCVVVLGPIGTMAINNRWSKNACTDVISFASCVLDVGVDHNHITNKIAKGNQSHRI